eukprot:5744559-Prymnesium_polylepis.1
MDTRPASPSSAVSFLHTAAACKGRRSPARPSGTASSGPLWLSARDRGPTFELRVTRIRVHSGRHVGPGLPFTLLVHVACSFIFDV